MTDDLADLPPDILEILRALAKEMHGRPVEPQFVHEAQYRIGNPLPGHTFVIHHVPRSAKGVRPTISPHYKISVAGKRLDGQWKIRPGRLSKLLKAMQS